jgi:hypothetical protein
VDHVTFQAGEEVVFTFSVVGVVLWRVWGFGG